MISSSAGGNGSDEADSGEDAEVESSDICVSRGGSATVVAADCGGAGVVEAGIAGGGVTRWLFAHHTVAQIAVAATSSRPAD
jgi:hypothetical protein